MAPKNLKQIYEESLYLAKFSAPVSIPAGGKLYKWKGTVTGFLFGELEFRRVPHFGLTLSDSSYFIPCILLDPSRSVDKILSLRCHTVLLSEPVFVVEIFRTESTEYGLVYVLLDAEKLHSMENIRFLTTTVEIPDDGLSNADGIAESVWYQHFVPLKVSSAVLTLKSEVFCFVLVLLIDRDRPSRCEDDDGNLVWLVFKNAQVLWRDLLLPYRLYTIATSHNVSRDYFRSFGSLISVVDKNLDATFYQMLHHRDLITTNAAVRVPINSKIFTTSLAASTNGNIDGCFSSADIGLATPKFVSVFGIVREAKYLEAWKSSACPWCCRDDDLHDRRFRSGLDFRKGIGAYASDYFRKLRANSAYTKLWFPRTWSNAAETEELIGFGIRGGKLIVRVSLQMRDSNDIVYVFIRRWRQLQYPVGLIPGLALCFTDVLVQCSKKNNRYFVSTPLTRIFLSKPSNIEGFDGQYFDERFRFPFVTSVASHVWGILELDMLADVSVNAKCKLCSRHFVEFRCSNSCCPNNNEKMNAEYEIVASAKVQVRNCAGTESSYLFLKNENVRKYLHFPGKYWQKLCSMSANLSLVYPRQSDSFEKENNVSGVFFHTYCEYFRPKRRFRALCQSFRNEENRFFCIELAEIPEV